MKIILIILGFLKWHYGRAVRSLIAIWGIFLSFVANYFSIELLFTNFFDPWKRMTDAYPKKIDLKEFFYAFITNIIVRILGILMRTFLITIGITAYTITILLFPLALICWLLLPFIVLSILMIGVFLIFK
jgi:hypothetical protein